MRKQNIQMLVLVSILVLCILGYLLVKAMPEEETQVNSQSHMVTNVIQEDVVEISYLYEGDIIELAKENDTHEFDIENGKVLILGKLLEKIIKLPYDDVQNII